MAYLDQIHVLYVEQEFLQHKNSKNLSIELTKRSSDESTCPPIFSNIIGFFQGVVTIKFSESPGKIKSTQTLSVIQYLWKKARFFLLFLTVRVMFCAEFMMFQVNRYQRDIHLT